MKKIIMILVSLFVVAMVAGCIESGTPEVTSTPKIQTIEGLASIGNPLAGSGNWDADPEDDGIKVLFSFYDSNGNILRFEGVPCTVEIELYAKGISAKEYKVVYSGTVIITSSKDDIRIPFEEININPERNYFGILEVTVHTPVQGDFKGTTNLFAL